jgi:hypothetical protein
LLSDIEEVLELLERAEAEKTADEQAIISLRQELDRIHRGPNLPRRPLREPFTQTAASEAAPPAES